MAIDVYDHTMNGATLSTQRFVERLREENDVLVLTTGQQAPGKIVLPEFYVPVFARVMKKMKISFAVPTREILVQAIKGSDILHIQFPFLLGMRSASIARKSGVPVVSTFHIQAEHLLMNAGINYRWLIRACYRVWMKRIYNVSDVVICPSKFAQEELTRYGLTAKSVIISNGLLPVFRPIPVKRADALKDKFVILNVGRFAPEKRQGMIIDAIDRSRYRDRIQLILAGDGPTKDKIAAQGRKLLHPPLMVTLHPEELVYYYNDADLYIHPAIVEVECMSALEAIGCGLPALISDSARSAARQFAIDDRFLFHCDSIQSLTEKIDYLIEHPGELNAAKELARQESLKYGISNSYAKLREVYSGLAGRA